MAKKGELKITSADKEEERWRVESDARLIQDYAKLKADSKRYEKAIKFIKEQKNELTKILKSKEV